MIGHTPDTSKALLSEHHQREYRKARKAETNARLIAAAPELLEALRNITECAEAGLDGANMDLWIDQARAAIAKAEGRP
jgi:hypothetical protein